MRALIAPEELKRRIEDFIAGRDRSKRAAAEIEVLLDAFGDAEPFATAAHMLASYEPAGGEFMYDEQAVVKQLEHVLRALA